MCALINAQVAHTPQHWQGGCANGTLLSVKKQQAFSLGRMCAGIVNAKKEELWIDQREEVGVGGELDTPLEEGTLGGGGRRQANVAAGRGGRALPAGNDDERGARAAASSGNAGGAAAAVNIKAAGRFKRPVDAAAAAAEGGNALRASAKGGSLIRDPEEDDDLALPALKKPSTHPMPLLGTVCISSHALLLFQLLLDSVLHPTKTQEVRSMQVYLK